MCFTLVYTYIEVLTLPNSDEQKSLFEAKNMPSITASTFGKILLFALLNHDFMANYTCLSNYNYESTS